MRTVRKVSLTGWIATRDQLVSPATGRAAAAIRLAFANDTDDIPSVCWLGDSIVIRSRWGGIRVDLRTAKVLCAEGASLSCQIPHDVGLEQLRPFAGAPCEETALGEDAPVALASSIRLARRAGIDAVWEACAAMGPVVVTLL